MLVVDVYEPAKGLPKIPTANSAQVKNKRARITPQAISLLCTDLNFLSATSMARPVISNKAPIIIKSLASQSTSLVNCIAIKGIIRIPTITATIINGLVFFIMIDFGYYFIFKVL